MVQPLTVGSLNLRGGTQTHVDLGTGGPQIDMTLRNEFFWTNSEKFVPNIGQPQERKSVITKDVSGVDSCIFRK